MRQIEATDSTRRALCCESFPSTLHTMRVLRIKRLGGRRFDRQLLFWRDRRTGLDPNSSFPSALRNNQPKDEQRNHNFFALIRGCTPNAMVCAVQLSQLCLSATNATAPWYAARLSLANTMHVVILVLVAVSGVMLSWRERFVPEAIRM